jgi:uridylate kinase
MATRQSKLRRVLLKLSGEALLGNEPYGVDPVMVGRIAAEIGTLSREDLEVGVVIGGGNIFRGAGLAQGGLDRVTADHMGMLATVMNCLALQDALQRIEVPCRVMSALSMEALCETYTRRQALRHLAAGRVVIFAAGTGNPFFTTDTAASLRAIEIGADVLFKATKVDGVYTADPKQNSNARRYTRLSYAQALHDELGVMDLTAMVLCRDHSMPMRVFNIFEEGALLRAARGESVGTLVQPTTEIEYA